MRDRSPFHSIQTKNSGRPCRRPQDWIGLELVLPTESNSCSVPSQILVQSPPLNKHFFHYGWESPEAAGAWRGFQPSREKQIDSTGGKGEIGMGFVDLMRHMSYMERQPDRRRRRTQVTSKCPPCCFNVRRGETIVFFFVLQMAISRGIEYNLVQTILYSIELVRFFYLFIQDPGCCGDCNG